ncbi:MAG TPA: phosphonate ABC transporter ATP-binding protein [Tepidiformaceae bacterium]|nr:phosphonate ABC transporter ATP-binding protein [Tepidiformaceae bacterium]
MASIEIRGLRKTFPNGHTALADVSFTVPSGQFVCVVGRSGAGKSTLLRCLNAALPVTSGEATVGGTAVSSLTSRERRGFQRGIGFIYQEFNLVGRLTALQNVLTGRLGHMPTWRALALYFGREDRAQALEALERVNMLHKAAQRTDSLSGGEKQRVAIARAFAQEPRVLLADEPVANLDPELAEGVLKDLRRVAKEAGVTTLINIHNISQARRYADRIIGIAQGEVVFDGDPEAFDLEAENAVYRFDQDVEEAPDLRRELDPHVVHDLDKALKRGLKRGKETETAIGSESGGGAQ